MLEKDNEKITFKYSNSSISLNMGKQKEKEAYKDDQNKDKSNISPEKKSDYISYILIHKINYIIKFNLIVHNSTEEEFQIKEINDIIYNEDKRIVSKFKDHLIYNDPAEFLRK
jgi:hypothetical protein